MRAWVRGGCLVRLISEANLVRARRRLFLRCRSRRLVHFAIVPDDILFIRYIHCSGWRHGACVISIAASQLSRAQSLGAPQSVSAAEADVETPNHPRPETRTRPQPFHNLGNVRPISSR